MPKLTPKRRPGLPRKLTGLERAKISLCDHSQPPRPAADWTDQQLWEWWCEHRTEMLRRCREAALASDAALVARGLTPYHGPTWGLPAAAAIWDSMTAAAATRGPAPVVELKKPEEKQ